ncbi:HEAT repeat domain-containing protein [Ktedonospora formicarum]|uniref:HEAT repeat domain-containing protein n=1 Tax=Ktedonospora formicarum TaxID=2778364 RepID=A0A8J3I1Y5_9CHLR|nr:HEAT repeat domain-containing protein [Ktedonospora formicarum]GHO47286.1 hypothetical protein KSX_54490 [Ktedonospora formicarum]
MSIPFEKDKDSAAIKSWCDALTDRDLEVRVAAARALARQGELARVLFSESTASVRIEAIMAVTSKKPSLPALITALQDTVSQGSVARARIAAANQLASLGDETAIAPLLAAAHDPNPRVREKMAQALHRLVHRLNTQKNRILFIFWVDRLVSSLKDDLLYETSLSVLVKIERGELSGTTIKPLVELLHSQGASASEREHIVDLLGESGQQAAVEPLCTALQDNHPDIRMKAAYALGKLGERAATKPLCAALQDTASKVCKAALWALAQLEDQAATGPLVDFLYRSSNVYEFERIAYDVLPVLRALGDTTASGLILDCIIKYFPSRSNWDDLSNSYYWANDYMQRTWDYEHPEEDPGVYLTRLLPETLIALCDEKTFQRLLAMTQDPSYSDFLRNYLERYISVLSQRFG